MTHLSPTLIRSKLLVPTPTNLLHRPRLCHAIEKGLDHKLTLVSAPAGYGKTSALVDFSRQISVPVCWYTADERDRDLSLFTRYVVGAVRERFSGFGQQTREALASQGSEVFRDPTGVVGELVNEMLDLDTDFVLVLDNFESVDAAFGVREFVHRLLEVLPPNCHLMMGSRVLPDVPVTRLVAKRQLIGLTERNLRFEPKEIRELLGRSQIEITEEQARAIAVSAEGWITGILLISDLLHEHAGSVISDTGKVTSRAYSYLASEVLDRQSWELRRFLYVSSVLREMSPRLCQEVLHIDRAHSLLAEVERHNLFVTRFGDDSRAVYRYHNLFRDFLQQRLRQQEPVHYAELHRQAAAWFEQQHEVEEAVHHYLAAAAYPQATALMERVAMEWFTRGRVETLLRWAEALPGEVRSQAPWLSLYQSRVLTDRYDCDGAHTALVHAEEGFTEKGDTACIAKAQNQRATLSLFEGRYEDALSEAQAALDLLEPGQTAERADARRHIGRACVRLGRFEAGVSELQRALTLFREIDSPYDVVNLLQDLTFTFAFRGRMDKAAGYLNEALPIARRLGSPTLLAGVLNNLGMLHYERQDYREALSLYQEGLAAARRGNDTRNQANLADGMACIYRDIGVYERAETLYDTAWRIARKSRPGQALQILVERADMYRWQGNQARALALLAQAQELAEQKDLETERRGLIAAGKGIALVESGDVEAGSSLLAESVLLLQKQGAKRDLAKARFLLAKASLMAGEEHEAVIELRRAAKLADEIGSIQFAVTEARHTPSLLQFARDRGVSGCSEFSKGISKLQAFEAELARDRLQPEDRSESRLEIYGFGEGRVVRDGCPIPSSAWQAAMAKELFFYILLHGPVERDAVGLVFWPDLSADKVTSNFHSTLYRVRRAVGSEAVVVERGRYRVGDVDYWFDVAEFDSLVERARLLPPHDWQTEELWQRAINLYHDDFLTDVDRAWCIPRREALRAQYVEALVGIGRCCEIRRAFEEAVSWYRRALEMDRLREDIHRRIMHCFVETDRRSRALAQFQRCREILDQELGIEPAPETMGLYEQIAGRHQD